MVGQCLSTMLMLVSMHWFIFVLNLPVAAWNIYRCVYTAAVSCSGCERTELGNMTVYSVRQQKYNCTGYTAGGTPLLSLHDVGHWKLIYGSLMVILYLSKDYLKDRHSSLASLMNNQCLVIHTCLHVFIYSRLVPAGTWRFRWETWACLIPLRSTTEVSSSPTWRRPW